MEISTDSDVTMIATKQFNCIVNEIQNSGLNYSLQVSPFSALISLRKTLVKDLSGSYIFPSQCQDEHCSCACNNKLSSLQKKYEEISAAHELANTQAGDGPKTALIRSFMDKILSSRSPKQSDRSKNAYAANYLYKVV